MKIIHLNYSDISGGAARATYRIHHSLIKKGVTSQMWVNKKISEDWTVKEPSSKISRVLNEVRPRLIRYILGKIFKTKDKVIHSSTLSSKWINHINNSDADIVHLHWIQNEMLSIKDISKIKKPIVWTLHDMWPFCGAEHYTDDNRWLEGYNSNNRPDYESGFDLNRWTWQRKKKYWKTPIQIITPSNWLAKCVTKSVLMKNWPVSIVPNPIDTNSWRPIDKTFSREYLNFPQDTQLLLCGSAIGSSADPRKGFDLIQSCLKLLLKNKQNKNVELLIFGQSRPEMPQDFGLPVHYVGNLQDETSLQCVYNAADVMLIPSRQDNLPNTAVEAHACGVPVVAFDIGGLSDIVKHQQTGYLAKAFDVVDFANGINWTLGHNKSMQLSKNARKHAELYFSEDKIAQEYTSIYNKILKME
jgi:glycosyltransferase involved in cell wall biosynthesis